MEENEKDCLTMNERIRNAGIRIIGKWISMGANGEGYFALEDGARGAMLEYRGKTIFRPTARRCVEVVKREFGLDI